MSDVHTKVIAMINDVCRPERPDLSDPDLPLLSGDIDSLDFASVLMALEDEFGLSLQDVNVEELNTLNKLVVYVDEHRKS